MPESLQKLDMPKAKKAPHPLCRLASLIPARFSLFPLKGCKPAPPPAVAGVSTELRYPVLLIGQRTFDGRDSEAALVNVPGASSLNLVGRVILDSDGRLFEVVSARVEAGSKPVLLDMGTTPRRHEVKREVGRKEPIPVAGAFMTPPQCVDSAIFS